MRRPAEVTVAVPTVLGCAANSRRVAYLDDDWWDRTHLAGLRTAIAGKAGAAGYRERAQAVRGALPDYSPSAPWAETMKGAV
jgi:hypothetical protein